MYEAADLYTDYNGKYYHFYLRVFIVVLFVIPVAAYFLGNLWLSTGILVFLVCSWAPWVVVPVLLLYSAYVWVTDGFSFAQYGTFFLLCSFVSAALFAIARKKIIKKPAAVDAKIETKAK
jgi:hypothetical protein